MDEEQETDKVEKEKPTKDSGEGDKPKTTTLIDDANLAAERLEAANARKAELIRQEEELLIKRRMSGTTEAGQKPEEKEKISDEEYANQAMTGVVPE